MPRHLHLGPELDDRAAAVHQRRGALDAHVGFSVHALLHPDAEGPEQNLLLIREQARAELVLVAELAVLLDRIGRNAEQLDAERRELRLQAGEVDGLLRAARCVVLRIEEQDEGLALQRGKRNGRAGVVGSWKSGQGDPMLIMDNVPSFRPIGL